MEIILKADTNYRALFLGLYRDLSQVCWNKSQES